MSPAGSVVVTGATGKQGGAAARQLLEGGWPVRALTRDPGSAAARALAELGAEVVRADLGDRASLVGPLEGAYGVFSVQNYWEHGHEAEVRQGTTLAETAAEAGVQHFVYSSVGGADRPGEVGHFRSKAEIEERLGDLDLRVTILRPVFLMENLEQPRYRDPIRGGTLALGLRPDVRLQLISALDVGRFARRAFDAPDELAGQAIEIAADERTGRELADALARALGREVRFVPAPLERIRAMNPEVAIMFEWFNRVGYRADLAACRALVPGLLDFEAWLSATDWGGRDA